MMRPTTKLLLAATFTVQLLPLAAHASPPTLAATLTRIATPLEAVKLPLLGTLSDVSLGTVGGLPGLSAVKLPLFGSLSGLPEIGTLKVSDGLGLVESLAVLQNPFQGFVLGTLPPILVLH